MTKSSLQDGVVVSVLAENLMLLSNGDTIQKRDAVIMGIFIILSYYKLCGQQGSYVIRALSRTKKPAHILMIPVGFDDPKIPLYINIGQET
jgi:hypothetical protein